MRPLQTLPASHGGKPTTFRVANVEPQACTVIADGERSDDWREVDGDIEISTTVSEHTFIFRMN